MSNRIPSSPPPKSAPAAHRLQPNQSIRAHTAKRAAAPPPPALSPGSDEVQLLLRPWPGDHSGGSVLLDELLQRIHQLTTHPYSTPARPGVPRPHDAPNPTLRTSARRQQAWSSNEVVVGINAVSQCLVDLMVRIGQVPQCTMAAASAQSSTLPSPRAAALGQEINLVKLAQRCPQLIFACNHDMGGLAYLNHLPTLVEETNRLLKAVFGSEGKHIDLITLPIGSEKRIADALGVKKASVMGLFASTPEIDKILGTSQGSNFQHDLGLAP